MNDPILHSRSFPWQTAVPHVGQVLTRVRPDGGGLCGAHRVDTEPGQDQEHRTGTGGQQSGGCPWCPPTPRLTRHSSRPACHLVWAFLTLARACKAQLPSTHGSPPPAAPVAPDPPDSICTGERGPGQEPAEGAPGLGGRLPRSLRLTCSKGPPALRGRPSAAGGSEVSWETLPSTDDSAV